MHVHALWDPIVTTTVLPLLLTQGVTGVRDMGGTLAVLQAARAGIVDGTLRSPRLVAAGPILDGLHARRPDGVAIAVATEATHVPPWTGWQARRWTSSRSTRCCPRRPSAP